MSLELSNLEQIRLKEITSLLPKGCNNILEIGARDGRVTELLCKTYSQVTALDLELPQFSFPNCKNTKGNVCNLEFEDNKFDLVICTEVLEHIPQLTNACNELSRVSSNYILIGVPYLQDTRLDQTTCQNCGKINPPWGHVNSFTKDKLLSLFPNYKAEQISFLGSKKDRTNSISVTLNNFAKNPWGAYNQKETCIHCGQKLLAPKNLSIAQRVCAKIAIKLTSLQNAFTKETPIWIHVLFSKK